MQGVLVVMAECSMLPVDALIYRDYMNSSFLLQYSSVYRCSMWSELTCLVSIALSHKETQALYQRVYHIVGNTNIAL